MISDEEVKANAVAFAKRHKKRIASERTDIEQYAPEERPISIFMAGSPGAGKTEIAKEYVAALDELESQGFKELGRILRIDPDDLREELPGYTGSNSRLFQGAVSILVDRIHDVMLKQRQSFLLDGTLAGFDIASKNIARSLKRERDVQIFYVYQHPLLAWRFVCSREKVEGRNIPLESFIEQFLSVQEVLNRVKREFGSRVCLDLIIKDTDHTNQHWESDIDSIDPFLPERYTHEQLKSLLLGEEEQ